MFTLTHALRAAALLAAAMVAMPASAQATADDPAAAVPETRYRPAHVHPKAPDPASTPDQNWKENNRIVAGQDSHAGHGGHGHHDNHGNHPAPARPQEPDPHAGHRGHHGQHQGQQHEKGHH